MYMPRLNMFCDLCKRKFKNSSKIQAACCGHIFHEECLKEWKKNGHDYCSKCFEHFHSSDYQLLLNLDDQEDTISEIKELRRKLQSSDARNQNLQKQINEVQSKFLQLQDKFLDQYNKSTETIKNLKQSILDLNIEDDKKTTEFETSDSVLKTENRILKLKLKYLGEELQKEITNKMKMV